MLGAGPNSARGQRGRRWQSGAIGRSVRVTLVTIALAPSLTACGENTKAPTEQPTVNKKTEPARTTDR